MKPKNLIISIVLLITMAGCGLAPQNGTSAIKSSGTISADEVRIAAEIGGKVASVNFREGDSVKAGDILFSLNTDLLQAQRDQAASAIDVAKANLQSSKSSLSSTQAQLDIALAQAQAKEPAMSLSDWKRSMPSDFKLPVWYFSTSEELQAAQDDIQAAQTSLDQAQQQLDQLLQDSNSTDIVAAEKRLALAETAYRSAKEVLDNANAATSPNDNLKTSAQDEFDAAKSELDAAQKSYDKLITTQKFSDIQEGRAKVAVARARLELAINHRDTLLRGSDDLAVKAAQANLTHAQDMVTQAQAAKTQAETSLKQIDIQISKMQVKSPEDGVILERALEVGEIVTPGATTIVLGNLNPLKVTAYIPEDQYGRITLGMEATVTVDSFPNQTFTGKVTHIADKAEFTPRNVQTVEGRKTTVIAVDIEIPNPDMKLKPGMPADIVFIEK